MGFFDFFKKQASIAKSQKILNAESKSLTKRNAAYQAIRDEEVRRLNRAYDFNSIEGINSIPVPCREVNGDSATGRVEYYLRGLCFERHRNDGAIDIAAACLRKAHELMFVSDMNWDYDAFISDVSWCHSVGLHSEAKVEEQKIDAHFKKIGFYPSLTMKDFADVKSYLAWKQNIENAEQERLRKRKIRHEYYWLQEYLPNLCPKSLSGYSRMKNSNSQNYQKLVREAAKLGKQV